MLIKYKRILIATSAILSVLLIIAAIFLLKTPDIIDHRFREELEKSGLNITAMPEAEKRITGLQYKNIQFGEDGINAIETLTIGFSPFSLLHKNLDSLHINEIFISGDIDINGTPHINGLGNTQSLLALDTLKFKNITISNINFSFLSAHLGGIRGIANIAANKENTATTWTGNIDSRQDQLEIIAKINGQLNQSGSWITDIEIENAKLERGFGKFTRVYGRATANGDKTTFASIKAELTAGGFIIYDTAWQNAAITLEGTPNTLKSFINAKSSGIDGLELGLDTIADTQNPLRWTANVHAETAQQLITFLSAHKMMPFEPKAFDAFKDQNDIDIRLAPRNRSIIFNITNQPQEIDIKGKIEDKNSNEFALIFTSPKNLEEGFKGAKCKKEGTLNQQRCRATIYYKDRQYTLQK